MRSRVIKLLGQPLQNETGTAGEVIKPGHLVKGVATILKQTASSAVPVPRNFALEREELGKGIDDTYAHYAGASAYAVGDTVKVGHFGPGMRVNALIASGQNIAEDAFLESAGDGTLKVRASGTAVGRAMEAVDNSTGTGTAGAGDAFISVELY